MVGKICTDPYNFAVGRRNFFKVENYLHLSIKAFHAVTLKSCEYVFLRRHNESFSWF